MLHLYLFSLIIEEKNFGEKIFEKQKLLKKRKIFENHQKLAKNP
jgi:hypothetical protein